MLVVVAFAFSNDPPPAEHGAGLTTQTDTSSAPAAPSGSAIRVALTAEKGDTWVTVRKGAPDGDILFAGTIYRGETQRFQAKKLWLEFADQPASNLQIRVNGHPAATVPDDKVLIVSPQGIRAQD